MTPQEFFIQKNGKGIDIDGKYGNQCVDLIRSYLRDVLKIDSYTLPAVSGPKQWWSNYPTNLFDRFDNLPTAVPETGDILIWECGQFGHTAIFIEGTVMTFTSFDQNWPSQGYTDINGNFIGTGVAHKQTHDYTTNDLLGWLRYKGQLESDMSTILLNYLGVNNDTEAKTKLKEHLGETQEKCDWGNADSDRGGHLGAARREIITLKDQLKQLQAQLANNITEVPTTNNNNYIDLSTIPQSISGLELSSLVYKLKK